MDFGLLLWTEDDFGLPTGPLTITKTLKHFFDNVLMRKGFQEDPVLEEIVSTGETQGYS